MGQSVACKVETVSFCAQLVPIAFIIAFIISFSDELDRNRCKVMEINCFLDTHREKLDKAANNITALTKEESSLKENED